MEFKDLNLVKDTKPVSRDKQVERRKRLIKNIDYQIQLADDELRGINTISGRKKASWFWLSRDGVYYCAVKYGKKPVELEKGRYAFVSPNLEEMIMGLDVIKEMVATGQLDSKMEEMSKDIRNNFQK